MPVPTPAAAMAIRDSLEEEVLIALVRAAWLAAERSNAVTAAAGLSPSQYNVLRILRAAGREGLSCTEIGTRMVTRDSDLTRLMSGLARAGLRSEEHTSELQSLAYLVCRLLLEKKKKHKQHRHGM